MSAEGLAGAVATDLVGNLAPVRVTALSAGDIGKATLTEVRRILKEQRGNQIAAAKVGVQQLVERNLITAREAKDLNDVIDAVFGAIRKKETGARSAVRVQRIYQGMVADSRVSPTALAIASVANAAFTMSDNDVEGGGESGTAAAAAVVITPETTGAGAVIGGIIGGVIGGVVGGGLGAGIGAAIGGAAGAAIGACNEAGV